MSKKSVLSVFVIGVLLVVEVLGYVLADRISDAAPTSTVRMIIIAAISVTIVVGLILWGTKR